MKNDTSDLIDTLYEKESSLTRNSEMSQIARKSPKAKYQIYDEQEFARGREVLGNLIVRGMIASGGTDIDWLIEHNGGFVILEFKKQVRSGLADRTTTRQTVTKTAYQN